MHLRADAFPFITRIVLSTPRLPKTPITLQTNPSRTKGYRLSSRHLAMDPYAVEPARKSPSAAGVVEEACTCTRCGYQLRDLSKDQRCPECAQPVALSLKGDRLRAADFEYVKALARGTNLILCALLLLFAAHSAAILAPLFGASGSLAGALLSLSRAGAHITLALGYWFYTTPDPARWGGESSAESPHKDPVSRFLLRAGALAYLACAMGAVVLDFFSSAPSIAQAIFAWTSIGGWALLTIFAVIYTRTVALRVPCYEVLLRCKFYVFVLPAIHILGLPFCGIGPVIALLMYAEMLRYLHQSLADIIAWRTRGSHVPWE